MLQYHFPKISPDTYTNTLACYGVADLVHKLQNDPNQTIQIIDEGTHYTITSPCELDEKARWNLTPFFELPTNTKELTKLPASIHPFLINMDTEKAKYQRHKEDATSPEAHPLYTHFWGIRFVNKAATPIRIITGIQAHPEAVKDVIGTYLESFARLSIPEIKTLLRADPLKKLFKTGSPSQVTDPIQCKGTNGLYSTEGNATIVNWFVEWMKWIGVLKYAGSITTDNTAVLYTILPHHISLRQIETLFKTLRTNKQINQQDGLKKDVLIYNLVIAECLKHHATYGEIDDPFSDETITKIIHGITFTTYMNMGNAYSPLHQHNYKAPAFINLFNRMQCVEWIAAYENLSGVFASCDVKKDAMELIVQYKDFIASEQLSDFSDFLALHSVHRFHSMKEKYTIKSFYSSTLATFLPAMVTDMKEIIDNPGFLAIAKAIKNATINGQYAKGRGQTWNWEIHYTLPTDLLRSARNKDTFVAELTNFINAYNRENAKIAEQHKDAKRKSISTDDLTHMMTLIDKYASKTLCNVLLAYGSASKPKDDAPSSGSPTPSGDIEGDTNDDE